MLTEVSSIVPLFWGSQIKQFCVLEKNGSRTKETKKKNSHTLFKFFPRKIKTVLRIYFFVLKILVSEIEWMSWQKHVTCVYILAMQFHKWQNVWTHTTQQIHMQNIPFTITLKTRFFSFSNTLTKFSSNKNLISFSLFYSNWMIWLQD